MSRAVQSDPGWKRRLWPARRRVLPLLLGLALSGAACAPKPFPGQAAPALAIRIVDETRDAAEIQRIEELRRKLPGRHGRRPNFAWARARIDGLEKTEYFAHSGIQRLGKFPAEVRRELEGISLRPREGRFEVLCVNHNDEVNGTNCFFRNSDTERKIIEDIERRLPDASAAGHILLYTDLYPCASCRHVMTQFLAIHTHVRIQVLFRER